MFKEFNITLAIPINLILRHQLKLKKKEPNSKKFGIYSINCQNCNMVQDQQYAIYWTYKKKY